MTEAKIHPPSQSRIAEARALGFAPRPLLVGLSAAIFALAVCVRAFAGALAHALTSLLRAPLDAFAQGDSARALVQVRPAITQLGELLALSVLGIVASVAFGLMLAQGVRLALPRANTRRFSAPKLSVEASLLAILGLLALCAFNLRDALWLEPAQLVDFCTSVLNQLAGLFLALAVVDAAFARAQFFRALFLTRRELREEQRDAFGAPELRAARAAARKRLSSEEL